MINFRSVSIKGAFNHARARVIWNNGVLKVFTINGMILSIGAQRPQVKRGFIRTWDVETAKGNITMRAKCMTCGGRKWWPVYYASDTDLWNSA